MYLPMVKLVHWSVVSGLHLIGQVFSVSNISPARGAVGRMTAVARCTRRESKGTLKEVDNMSISRYAG